MIQSLCSLNPSPHSWDCQGGCHTLPADEMTFCEGDECPRKYFHSDKPLGSWEGFGKPQWGWNMSTWASFIITLLSSCLTIRMNSSVVSCDLGDMKVEPCCSHYLKFQIFFGLLGYNTEHLIPLISSFKLSFDWMEPFQFFSIFLFLILHGFYCFISSLAFLGHCSLSILTFIKVLVTKYQWPLFIFLLLHQGRAVWFGAALCYRISELMAWGIKPHFFSPDEDVHSVHWVSVFG